MSRRRVYPWPLERYAESLIEAPDRRRATAIQTAAAKFAYRYRFVYRTKWDGKVLRVRRAA